MNNATVNSMLLWHGACTGDKDVVLRTVMMQGMKRGFSRPAKHMQQPGVFFTSAKKWAAAYALRLSDPRHHYHAPGKPFLAAVSFDPALDWDLDYELSDGTAFEFLRLYRKDLAAFPADKLRIVLTKANLTAKYPDATPAEKSDIVADRTLVEIKMQDTGPHLLFRDNLDNGKPAGIDINWNTGEVKGVQRRTATFANIMEQLTHHIRDLHAPAFHDFVREQTQAAFTNNGEIALKYMGAAPLPVVMAEVRAGQRWKPAILSSSLPQTGTVRNLSLIHI